MLSTSKMAEKWVHIKIEGLESKQTRFDGLSYHISLKMLEFYNRIIFWWKCLLFFYPLSHNSLRWRNSIIPVYMVGYGQILNWSKTLQLSLLPARMKKIKSKMKALECGITKYRNGPKRTGTDRNGPERTETDFADTETDQQIYRNGPKGTLHTPKRTLPIPKTVPERTSQIPKRTSKYTGTDRNGLCIHWNGRISLHIPAV